LFGEGNRMSIISTIIR